MTLTYLGPQIGAGDLIVPAAGDVLDPLLAEAMLLLRASTWADPADIANEGTLGGVPADCTAGIVSSSSWSGTALLGCMTKNGGYDTAGSWFTNLDLACEFNIPPVFSNNPASRWAEVFHIPVTGGGGNTEWLEFGPVFKDDGTVNIGLDFESGSETGGPSWQSDAVGRWDDGTGVAMATWRITVVAATGAIELFKNGVSVQTDSFGETVAFPEPASGEVVQVGPFQYPVAVKSVSLKDGIGGSEIIGWTSASMTGWTFGGNGATSMRGSAPAVPFFYVGGNNPVAFADDAAFNIAADGAVTVAALWRMGDNTNRGEGVTHFTSSSIPGWAVVPGNFIGGDGTTLAAAVSAGGAPSVIVVGAPTPGERQLVVTVVDLDGDLSGFLDGVEATPADISSLGAINATDALKATGFVEAWAIWDRALSDAEITVDLPAALGV